MTQQDFTADIAWAAGVYEGEGTTGLFRQKGQAQIRPFLTIMMRDRDVLERVRIAFGRGVIGGPALHYGSRSPLWFWRCYRHQDILAVLTLIFPLLGVRRKEQAAPVIEHVTALNNRKCRCGCGESLAGRNSNANFARSKCRDRYRYQNDTEYRERVKAQQKALRAPAIAAARAVRPERFCLCGCGVDLTQRNLNARVHNSACWARAAKAGAFGEREK